MLQIYINVAKKVVNIQPFCVFSVITYRHPKPLACDAYPFHYEFYGEAYKALVILKSSNSIIGIPIKDADG